MSDNVMRVKSIPCPQCGGTADGFKDMDDANAKPWHDCGRCHWNDIGAK